MHRTTRYRLRMAKTALDTLATTAVLVVCSIVICAVATGRGTLFGRSFAPTPAAADRTPPPLPTDPVTLDGAILRGSDQAPIAVIEYSEFSCPFCGKFVRETWPEINERYVSAGKVRWAFRHFPLESIHPDAFKAAEAAQCAAAEGKFWDMHRLLFSSAGKFPTESLFDFAGQLNLGRDRFRTCMAGETAGKIRQDMAGGLALGVRGTPAFLVGAVQEDGRVKLMHRIAGAAPLAKFEAVLEDVLAKATAANRPR